MYENIDKWYLTMQPAIDVYINHIAGTHARRDWLRNMK